MYVQFSVLSAVKNCGGISPIKSRNLFLMRIERYLNQVQRNRSKKQFVEISLKGLVYF